MMTRTGAMHFAVAGLKEKKAESRARKNDKSSINQFHEPLALPVPWK